MKADLVIFDSAGYKMIGDEGEVRRWYTPEGDVLGLYYYAIRPNIEACLSDLGALCRFYSTMAYGAGLGVVEIDTIHVDKVLSVRTVFKAPQQPSGMTYLGSLTFPFEHFSYVLKCQCLELGLTGLRDAVVLEQALGDGRVVRGGRKVKHVAVEKCNT